MFANYAMIWTYQQESEKDLMAVLLPFWSREGDCAEQSTEMLNFNLRPLGVTVFEPVVQCETVFNPLRDTAFACRLDGINKFDPHN